MTPDLLIALRALEQQWRTWAKADARGGVKEALKSQREYYGRVNAAFAFAECADQLADVLTKYENKTKTDDLLGNTAGAATSTELHDETTR